MAKKRQHWLVTFSEASLENSWIVEDPSLLHSVRLSRRPTAMRSGDRLVYYAGGEQKLFAIAGASQGGESASEEPSPDHKGRPWVLSVQLLVAIPTLALAPSWKELGLSSAVVGGRNTFFQLEDAQYEKARELICHKP